MPPNANGWLGTWSASGDNKGCFPLAMWAEEKLGTMAAEKKLMLLLVCVQPVVHVGIYIQGGCRLPRHTGPLLLRCNLKEDYLAKAATLVGRNVHLTHLDEELIGRGFRVVDLRAGGTMWTLGFRNRYGTTGTTT